MRKNLREVIRGLLVIVSFYWFFVHTNNTNIYSLIFILLGSLIIPELLVPRKKTSTGSTAKKKLQKSEVKKNTSNHNRLSSNEEIMNMTLDEMSWREFERLCYLYFKAKGYKPQETEEGADGGVDLILIDKKDKVKIAVQIKHYNNRIGVEPIRELYASKSNHKCLYAYFITTSSFTKDALLQADKFRIDTFDRGWVESNIIKWKDKQARNKK